MTGFKTDPEAQLEEDASSLKLWHKYAMVLDVLAERLDEAAGPVAAEEFSRNAERNIALSFKAAYDAYVDSGGDSDDATSASTQPSINGKDDLTTLSSAASGEGGPAVAPPAPATLISATETKLPNEPTPRSSLPSFAVADCNQQGIRSQDNLSTPATRDCDDSWDPAPHTAANTAPYTAAGNKATVSVHYGWGPAPAPTAGNQAHTTAKPHAFWAPYYSLPQAHNDWVPCPQHTAFSPAAPQPSIATVGAAATTTEPANTFPATNVWSAETQTKQPQTAAPNAENKLDAASNADAHHVLKSKKLSATPTLKTPSPSGLSPKAPVFTPKTLESSSLDILYKPPKNAQAESDKPQATPLRACFHCGLTGHFSSECQVAEQSKSCQSGGQDSNPDDHLPRGSSENAIPTACDSAGDPARKSTQEENGATAPEPSDSTAGSQCSHSTNTAVPENNSAGSATKSAADALLDTCPVAMLHEGYEALALQWSDRLEDVRQHVSAEGMLKFFALNNSIFDLIDEQECKESITLKLLLSASKGTKIQVKPIGRNWAPIYAAEIKAAADDRAKARVEAFHTVAGLARGLANHKQHGKTIDTCVDQFKAASF